MGLYSENRFKKLLAESFEEAPEVSTQESAKEEAPDVSTQEAVEAPEVTAQESAILAEEAVIDELLAMLD